METLYLALCGHRVVARGTHDAVRDATRPYADNSSGPLLVFEEATGRQTDFDWRQAPRPGPGRPKLGVVSTEVTLLPRHWEWLNAQPARASGTLRRLVEEAMAREADSPKRRLEALGRILWALAGDLPGFEEASRALYAGDRDRLAALTRGWPGDLPQVVREWP